MKKILLIVIVLILTLSVIACGKTAGQNQTSTVTPRPTTAQPRPTAVAQQPNQKSAAANVQPAPVAAAPLGARYAPTTKTMSGVKIHIYFEGGNCFVELTNETDKNLTVALSMSFKKLMRDNPGDDRGLTLVLSGGAPIENISLNPKGAWKWDFAVPKNYAEAPENDLTKLYYEAYIFIRN